MNTHRQMVGGEVRRSGDGGRTIEMRMLTYNVADMMGTVWAPGCLTKSLNERMPVVAFAHDWSLVAGRGVSWRDSADGPYLTARLSDPDDVPLARQLISQIADGTLTDVSIGFHRGRYRPLTEAEEKRWPTGREVMIEAECDEISIVARGAVPGAELVGQRDRKAKSPGWALARAYAEGRISAAEFERQAQLERETEIALDIVQAARLRAIEPHLDDLSNADRAVWVRARRELARTQARREGKR